MEHAEQIHDATANAAPLSPETRAQLRRMSIVFTHPDPGRGGRTG